MKLTLIREKCTTTYTAGRLLADGVDFCLTLEDIDRRIEAGGKKIPGDTCIPRGTYPVVIDFSRRFRREMLHVLDVPQFDGIRIHAGNTVADTEGCILLGSEMAAGFLRNSRTTVQRLFDRVRSALAAGGTVTLEVR